MGSGPLSTLLHLELRRGWTVLRRVVPPMVVVGAVFVLVEGGAEEGWGMALGILVFGLGSLPGLRALPDKVDGTVEFLTSLPVTDRTLATAHLVSCIAWASAAAPLGALSMRLLAPAELPGILWSPKATLLAGLACWTALTLFSALGAAVVIRFSMESLGWIPVAGILGVVAASAAADRLWPGLDDRLVAWALAGPPLWLLAAVALATAAAGALVAHGLLAAGYDRFRPSDAGLPGE